MGAAADESTSVRSQIERSSSSGLGDVADRDVTELPTARARVVEVARALMTQPKVLLLDEPASGQTEQETEAFGNLLRQLVDERKLAICLVEHDVSLVMGTCELIHVLDYGEIIAERHTRRRSSKIPAVVNAYLGRHERQRCRRAHPRAAGHSGPATDRSRSSTG